MLNLYQRDPDEFRRVVGIIAAGMRASEVYGFLRNRSILLAVALDLPWRSNRNALLEAIIEKIATDRPTEPHIPADAIPPVVPVAPTPEPQPEPEPPGPICKGCGGIGDTPRFLRWAKVARGEAVTVSENTSAKPASLAWLTPEVIMKEWFAPWEVDTSIRFEFITEGVADIRIGYQPIDGEGGTQGFAWQPSQSAEFMEQGGDLSGDMFLDSIERWERRSRDSVNEVGEHEVGHAIGGPHTDNPEDVLYAFTSGRRKPHSINDKKMKTLRYPPIKPSIAA